MEPVKHVEPTNTITALGNGAVRVQPFVCKLPSERRKERKAQHSSAGHHFPSGDNEEQIDFMKREDQETPTIFSKGGNNNNNNEPLLGGSERNMAIQDFISKSRRSHGASSQLHKTGRGGGKYASLCIVFLIFGLIISLIGLVVSYFLYMA